MSHRSLATRRQPSGAPKDTAESLTELIPEGKDPAGFLLHLARDHDLPFSRGQGAIRMYHKRDVRDAIEACEATCGAEPSRIRLQLAQQTQEEEAARRRDEEAAARRAAREAAGEPPPRGANTRLKVEADAKDQGLVTTWHIAEAYPGFQESNTVLVTLDSNRLARLRKDGLQAVGKSGKSLLYRAADVEAAATQRGVERTKGWPSWIENA